MARSRINRKHRAFCEAYKITASVTKAAKAAGVDRTQHYEWLKGIPEYAALFDAAQEEAAQTLEDEAVRRAHEGVTQAVFYQGKPIGAKRIYSDTLIIFLLKALRPEKYREHADLELSGPAGGPIALKDETLSTLTDDQLADLIRITRLITTAGSDGGGTAPPRPK